jgi:hypothetical protein
VNITTRTTIAGTIIGALALLLAVPHTRPASAAPPPYTAVLFDGLVSTQPQWVAPAGAPAQAYINGQACGTGFVDASAPSQGLMNAVFSVPDTCAYPGAPVEFLVNGYWLQETAGWGLGVTSISGGWAYTPVQTTLQLGPAGYWTGTVYGVPAGAIVEARIAGKVCGTTQTYAIPSRTRLVTSGYYLKVVPAAPTPYGAANCGFDGAKVEFFVNGVKMSAEPTWSWGLHSANLAP